MLAKKGISPVVATILLVLVTVVAVGVLAEFVVPYIKDTLSKSTECSDVDQVFNFDESFNLNCRKVSGANWNLTISVNRKNDNSDAIDGFLLIFYTNDSSKTVQIINGIDKTSEFNMVNSTKQKIEIPLPGETRSYIYHHPSNVIYKKGEIKTILKTGKVCEKVSSSIDFSECT